MNLPAELMTKSPHRGPMMEGWRVAVEAGGTPRRRVESGDRGRDRGVQPEGRLAELLDPLPPLHESGARPCLRRGPDFPDTEAIATLPKCSGQESPQGDRRTNLTAGRDLPRGKPERLRLAG